MDWSTIRGLVARHALSVSAGWLMSHGFLAADGSMTEAFIGIGMGLGAGLLSWWQKTGKVMVDAELAKRKGIHPDAIKAAGVTLAMFGILALATPTHAADMVPVYKAPSTYAGFPYNGSGFYYGLNTFAEIKDSTVDVAGARSGLFQAGAAVGGTVGYQRGNGTSFVAIEAMVNIANTGANAAATATDIKSRYSFEQRVKFGGPLANVLNFLPASSGATFPALPALGAPNGAAHPYLMVGLHESRESVDVLGIARDKWQFKGAVGVGVMQQFANGIAADAWVEYSPKQGGFTVGGPIATNPGQVYRIGAGLYY